MCFRLSTFRLLGVLVTLTSLCQADSNVTIVNTLTPAQTAGGTYGGTNPVIFTPTADSALAIRANIETALNLGRAVTINTDSTAMGGGDLTLSVGLQKIDGASSTLTFNAERDLVANGYIYSSSGALPLVLKAGRNMSNSQVLNSNGGNLTLNVGGLFELGANLTAGTGNLLVQNGILTSLTPMTLTGASVQFSDSAALRFPGTIVGNLIMAGSLSPGAPRAAKNLQINGSLTLTSAATTLMELAGTVTPGSSYDRIKTTGAVALAGNLSVAMLSGFEDRVQATDVFTILEGGSISGTFTDLPHDARLTLPNSQGSFRIRYSITKVTLDDWQPVIQTLTWDPGTELNGTQIFSKTNSPKGRHIFRLQTMAAVTGAWRTRLTVTSGSAELYLSKGYIPSNLSYLHAAKGADPTAIILREDQYTADEEWYVMVYATEDASWSLFSGEAYAHNLGSLPYTDSNVNGRYDIGEPTSDQTVPATTIPAEKLLFYKVTVPPGALAWSLWLNGANYEIAVRKDKVPFHVSWPYYAKKQAGQLLLTAPALSEAGGTYYFAIEASVGETFQIQSKMQSVTPLPIQADTPSTTVTGAPYRVYQIHVPTGLEAWAVSTTAIAGNPNLALRKGTVPSERENDAYSEAAGTATDSITLVQEEVRPGPWFVTVYGTAGFTFTLHSTDNITQPVDYDTADLSFNNGTASITGQAPGTWIYRKVTVPGGVLGWDIRVRNVTGGTPQLVVRRDRLPTSFATLPWTDPGLFTAWATGHQWAGETDWTQRPFESGGTVLAAPRRLVMAQGRPLEPGTYFVGIFNSHATSHAAYVLESRGIGSGQAFTAQTLAVSGASQSISNLPLRDPAYFKVTLPAGLPSWQLRLTPTVGEMMLCARQGAIPDFLADNPGGNLQGGPSDQARVQKTGNEHYVLLPPDGEDVLVAGDYYLAVIGEGVSPADPSATGLGSTSGTLATLGALPVTQLGSISGTGISQSVSLEGGQIKSFRFTLPANAGPLEVRLDNRTGNPSLSLIDGARIASPRLSDSGGYGWSGGQQAGTVREEGLSLIQLARPPAGTYHLTLRAGAVDNAFPNANATLVIRPQGTLTLNLDASLNGNGSSHSDSRQLVHGQTVQYQVTVPGTIGGQPLLGWQLTTSHLKGGTSMRIFKAGDPPEQDLLVFSNTALVVPPLLTPGDWRVELQASDLTEYTLTSKQITLSQSAWTLPAGFSSSTFGDTSSVNLPADGWHFYAVDVPAGNSGLLRTELQGLAGNPDLYIREDGVPTPDHDSAGPLGSSQSLIHRRLVQPATIDLPGNVFRPTTEHGNWVPLDGRFETRLRPGRWHLAVKAESGLAARYRLRVSTGDVVSLPLSSGTLAGQFLAKGDWRYYQFTVPEAAPAYWQLTFSETVGNVVMWLRDSLPPGNNQVGNETNDQGSVDGLRSWYGDAKNQGPYDSNGYDIPGIHTFGTPPLRPGHTYYVGFQAKVDSTFTLQSGTAGGTLPVPALLGYADGSASATLAPGASLLYRVIPPANATRMVWQATHPGTVQIRVEQGSLPDLTGLQHWTSGSAANSQFSRVLSTTSWPWLPARTYYLRIINNGNAAAPFSLSMDGRDPTTADEDLDGLPDAWEKLYYTDEHDAAGLSDTDLDGLTNLVEFAFNLNPTINALPVLTPGTGLSGLPFIRVAGAAPDLRLRVEFIRRRYRGLSYEVQFSNDPSSGGWLPTTATPTITAINTDWERVVIDDTETVQSAPLRFARVIVSAAE